MRASQILARVYAGESLAEAGALEPAVQDLCYASLRDYGYLDALITALLHKPLTDAKLRALFCCALREIQRGRATEFTVVNETVKACAQLGHAAAKPLVNGVLRNYLRRRDEIEAQAQTTEPGRWRHPQWWIDAVKAAYPQNWRNILDAGNQHPPMSLRVNRRRSDAGQVLKELIDAGIGARHLGAETLFLDRARPAAQIPGFAEGVLSVQDAAAQHAARLLDVADGMHVLDACAAPGGKTAHILECAQVELLALDRDPRRAARIEDNLRRLGLRATVRTADAVALETWWRGESFDRILLDAPCSASGVARRHPDIKWLRRAEDIPAFAAQQAALLEALWRVLSPGGKLLYATCSVFPEENRRQVEAFTSRHKEARLLPLPPELPSDGQLLPDAQHDGFYYALMMKILT